MNKKLQLKISLINQSINRVQKAGFTKNINSKSNALFCSKHTAKIKQIFKNFNIEIVIENLLKMKLNAQKTTQIKVLCRMLVKLASGPLIL